jgi:hypothetical protein
MPRLGPAVALLLLLAAPARAQGDIEPDRPSVSTSTRTVPARAVQLETGMEYSQASGGAVEHRLGVEATLRAGITERLELRLEGEPLVHLHGPDDDTGHGDLSLGVKYRFVESDEAAGRPALGVLPFVKLPLASAPIGSERVDFGLFLLASMDLPWALSLDANAGVTAVGQRRPDGFIVQALASASLARRVLERLTVFGELFFASRDERDGRHRLGADAGLGVLVTRALALDGAVETTLSGDGADYAVRAGLSVRFGGR